MITADLDLSSLNHSSLISLSTPILQIVASTPYTPPQSSPISIKSLLSSLLPSPTSPHSIHKQALDFCLCCGALASASGQDSPSLHWIPKHLSAAAESGLNELARTVGVGEVRVLVEMMMPEVFPVLKGVIKESCVDVEDETVGSSSAKVDVAHAVVASHQFRWFVTQVGYPHLGKLCPLVIPCALTSLDHWSPEVKDQGMVSFIHLAKNVNSAELAWYEEPILDACHRNIASSDELWLHVVEMSVLLLTSILRRNPRSPWFERIFTEMLSHLERQPMNKDRRTAWLLLVKPVLAAMGLILLAHFRRFFSLLFMWLHADDDKTLILVLECIYVIVKLTWIRKSPFFDKLVDELTVVYKEASMRKEREAIHTHILQILILLKQCKGSQFDSAWEKHKNDSNLDALLLSIGEHQRQTDF